MRKIKVAVIAHGLGMSRGYSGEGLVYKAFFEMLSERGINYVAVSFSKPYETSIPSLYTLPFHLPKFDKYQRLLTYFPARKVKPELYLNASGVPIPLSDIAPHIIYAGAPAVSSLPSKYTTSFFWRLYLLPFKFVVNRIKDEAKRAKIIANSRYSAKAISEVYGIKEPDVIYPPVDVEYFQRGYNEGKREDYFVSIARIERGKMLENALLLSAKSGIRGIIIGSLIEKDYFKKLIKLRERLKANVEFLPNLPREELVNILSKAKAYFHPTIGEHFGIPVVEAMSAGVIPIVPKQSGAFEVVPEFSYSSIDEAVDILKGIVNNDNLGLRREMKERAMNFSRRNFKSKIMYVISEFLNK